MNVDLQAPTHIDVANAPYASLLLGLSHFDDGENSGLSMSQVRSTVSMVVDLYLDVCIRSVVQPCC